MIIKLRNKRSWKFKSEVLILWDPLETRITANRNGVKPINKKVSILNHFYHLKFHFAKNCPDTMRYIGCKRDR